MINVVMGSVFDIRTIQKMLVFASVMKDGLDDIVLFNILVRAHLIHYVLVSQPTIDRYVFVLGINLALDVFLSIHYVKWMIIPHVKMVVNVFLIWMIWYPIQALHVSVEKALVEIDVK
jgi:hypothetical protein